MLQINTLTRLGTGLALGSAMLPALAGAQPLPPVLENLGIPDARVETRFETEVPGVTGYVVRMGGESNLIYTVDEGRHALVGVLIGEDGRNHTEAHAVKHLGMNPTDGLPERGADDGMDADRALDAVESAPLYIQEGSGDPVVYVTLDPQCPHCARYYDASRSVLEEVTIRWIPVAILGPESLRQAALLVEADDPVQALESMKAGGLDGEPGPESEAIVRENTQQLTQAGIRATPTTVYKSRDGDARVLRGALDAARLRELR